jgi:hypothetical protein
MEYPPNLLLGIVQDLEGADAVLLGPGPFAPLLVLSASRLDPWRFRATYHTSLAILDLRSGRLTEPVWYRPGVQAAEDLGIRYSPVDALELARQYPILQAHADAFAAHMRKLAFTASQTLSAFGVRNIAIVGDAHLALPLLEAEAHRSRPSGPTT